MIEDMDYSDGATPLDPDEMGGLIYSHLTTRGELDELESTNIDSGLYWLSRQRNPDVLTDHFARDLHRHLFGDVWEWAGMYRLTEKNIGINPMQISVQLRQLLDDAQYWVDNHIYEPKETALRLHHKLVYIHLFPNGNGRHARIMADTMMEKLFDEEPIDWAGGYDLQKNNEGRKQYIASLRAADGGNYKPLFDFVGYQQSQ